MFRYTLVRQRSGRQSLRGRLVGQANKRVDVLGSSALIDTEAHERLALRCRHRLGGTQIWRGEAEQSDQHQRRQ